MKTERIQRAAEGRTTESPQGFGARARGALVLRHFGKGKRPESGRRLPQSKTQAQEAGLVVPTVLDDRSAAQPSPPLRVFASSWLIQGRQDRSRFPKPIQGDLSSFSPIQGCFGKKLFILSFSSPGALAVSNAFQAVPRCPKPFQGFFQKKKIVYIPTTASVTAPSSRQRKAGKGSLM